MAYQNVGTPRFYINAMEWGSSVGVTSFSNNVWRTLPVNPTSFKYIKESEPGDNVPFMGQVDGENRDFIAILGHDIADSWFGISRNTNATDEGSSGWGDTIQLTDIVNLGELSASYEYIPTYDGFTIASFDGSGNAGIGFNMERWNNVGSVVIGSFYDMPHSPDLSLTMSREYGGIKEITTKGGASLSNANWTRPPAWGTLGAWELYSSNLGAPKPAELSQSGRRIWDLSFSYLDDGDVFGANQHLWGSPWGVQTSPPYDSEDINSNYLNTDILNNDNFYSQVIHKTAGHLPFIFQPNKDDNTNFAICKFDQKSFQFKQVAHNTYSISLKIREVW